MSNQEFENYLRLIGKLLQLNRQQCDQIAGELRDHLEMRVEELTSQGMSRSESVRQAIEELGDAAALARNFQQVNNLMRRRWMMRFATFSIVGIFLAAVCAISLWPVNARFGAPGRSVAQSESNPGGVSEQEASQADSGLVGSDATQRNRMAELKLKEPCQFDYDETPFVDIMNELAKQTGLNFMLSNSARDDSLTEDEPISCNLVNVPLNRALNLMLESKNATYVIDNGVVIFISLDDHEDSRYFRLKVFDCKQLVKLLPESYSSKSVAVEGGSATANLNRGGSNTGHPFGQASGSQTADKQPTSSGPASIDAQVRQDVQTYLKANYPPQVPTREATLLKLVQSLVAADSWKETGNGLAEAKAVNGVLIVNQTEAALQQIENLLEDLEQNLTNQLGNLNVGGLPISGVPMGAERLRLFRNGSVPPVAK